MKSVFVLIALTLTIPAPAHADPLKVAWSRAAGYLLRNRLPAPNYGAPQ
jgi:hypothetical protein